MPSEAKILHDLSDGISGADVVMSLRIQRERIDKLDDIPSVDEYYTNYGVSHDLMRLAAPDAIVMHPGPMNRGIEIESRLADSDSSVIEAQVKNGVAVRMAVLATVIRKSGRPVPEVTSAFSEAKINRSTLFVEEARVINVEKLPAEQFVIRLHAPKTAAQSTSGTFVHVQCDEMIMMRRPLSIMRANSKQGWIEVLFKIVGDGLKQLADKKSGEIVSSIGPIGNGFKPNPDRQKSILIGGGVGIPPMIFSRRATER